MLNSTMLPVALMMQLYRVKTTLTIIAKLLPYNFFIGMDLR